MHRHGELIEEPVLAQEQRPWGPPVVRETHLGVPLSEVGVDAARVLETQAHLDELEGRASAADAQLDLVLRMFEVYLCVRDKPWRSEDVLATGIDQSQHAGTHLSANEPNAD